MALSGPSGLLFNAYILSEGAALGYLKDQEITYRAYMNGFGETALSLRAEDRERGRREEKDEKTEKADGLVTGRLK